LSFIYNILIGLGIILGIYIYVVLVLKNFRRLERIIGCNYYSDYFEILELKHKTIIVLCFIPCSLNILQQTERFIKRFIEHFNFTKKYIEYDNSLEKIIDNVRK